MDNQQLDEAVQGLTRCDVNDQCPHKIVSVRDVQVVLAALDDARKDSERLDWLDRDCFTCGTNADGPVFVTSAENGEDFFGDTFREAIDEAREK